MGAKPPSGGGAAPKLPPPPQQPKDPSTTGTAKQRRKGVSRNRTLLTQGLGGGYGGATTEKKGLLGE